MLPVSALNIGLVAGIPVLQAQITELQLDIERLSAAIQAQAEVSLNIPSLPALSASLAGYIAVLPTLFDPTKIVSASLDANFDITAQLGLLSIVLELVGEVNTSFQAGLSAPGLALWTYSGRAASFGEKLEQQTVTGYASTGPEEQIQALIVATENLDSWKSFGSGFNVGRSADAAASAASSKLTFEGELSGGKLNTGVLELSAFVKLYLASLEALKLNLEASLNFTLGLNLPDFQVLLDAALNIDLDLALDSLINIQVDLALQIELLQLRIDFFANIIAELNAALSAGGLALWVYGGPASGLGSALKSAVVDGIPGGSGPDAVSYGCVVATKLPAVWAAFGGIFATG